MLVTFLSNPHFVDGMDEMDYKLSLLQADNASLSYLLDVYKTNLANYQIYFSDYSEDCNFYQQSLVSEANKAYNRSKKLSYKDKFWQAANQSYLGTRDYSILRDIFIKLLKYLGLMLLGGIGVVLILSVILSVFN